MKAEKDSVREWELHAARIYLSCEMENDLQNEGSCSGNRRDDGAVPGNPIPQHRFLEASLVYYHPSFIGYMKAIAYLFKQSLTHEERKDFILIGRHRKK